MKETTTPLVYIILVNWNGKEDTLACLDSLQKIAYTNHKILVVDNASTDGSVEAVHKKDTEIEIIRNDKNERFARANNQGMAQALSRGADYVLLLNNDTIVDSAFLNFLIERAESDPAIGMVGGKIYYADRPDFIWFAGGIIKLWQGLIAHIGIREVDTGQFDRPYEIDYVTGCCLLASRNCIKAIGELDESYFMYTEDADWCWRARRAGFKIYFEPHAKIWHKISASSGGSEISGGLTAFKIYYKIRGMLKFFARYAKWYDWPTIKIFWLVRFIRTVFMMIVAKNWAGLKAMLSSLFHTKTQPHHK
jgi:GT2 family glycosyltransferase